MGIRSNIEQKSQYASALTLAFLAALSVLD
jgi:hypothetical protein